MLEERKKYSKQAPTFGLGLASGFGGAGLCGERDNKSSLISALRITVNSTLVFCDSLCLHLSTWEISSWAAKEKEKTRWSLWPHQTEALTDGMLLTPGGWHTYCLTVLSEIKTNTTIINHTCIYCLPLNPLQLPAREQKTDSHIKDAARIVQCL